MVEFGQVPCACVTFNEKRRQFGLGIPEALFNNPTLLT
ncbi:hypothetical protein MC7420_1644 [Coleofasciculus chthonoplastes PCC 7420]|uniref:Uncharacterized protein n=1 Tax=Coleofasciculus chthonoplastes PCC 7420 TaxID=118168 RepID=B4W391_9CYAN|nr:hypothetical protein MC7420_1644 [Coleofasciculus chthonoplastes PCC 7420]